MNLQQIIDRQAQHLQYDLDNYVNASTGADLTNAEVTAQVNEAIRMISLYIEQYHHSIIFTPAADQADYDMRDVTTPIVSRKVVKPREVIINGNPLREASGQGYGTWSMLEFQNRYPTWRTAPSGTPFIAVYPTDGTLILYPPPTQAVIDSGNCFIAGQYMAADLDAILDLNNSPDLPEELHPAVAYLSAILAAEPTVSLGEALTRLGLYNKRWMEIADKVKRRNANAQSPIGRYVSPADSTVMLT